MTHRLDNLRNTDEKYARIKDIPFVFSNFADRLGVIWPEVRSKELGLPEWEGREK